NRAPDRLEHAVLPESNPVRLPKSVVAPGEGATFLFALSICLGALLYLQLPIEPSTVMIAAGFGVMSIAAIGAQRVGLPASLKVIIILLAGTMTGLAAGKLRTETSGTTVIPQLTGPVMVEGWISNIEPASTGVRLRIRPHAIARFDSSQLPKEIRLTHRLDLRVSSGRFVRCWAVLRPPPGPAIPGDYDFRRAAWFDGLGGVGYVQGRCRGGVLGPPPSLGQRFELYVAARRRQLANYVNTVAGERAGGFAAALVSGDRSYMPEADQTALRASGLAHLLAISGLHLGIVGGLIYFIVRRSLAVIEPLSIRYPVQKAAAFAAIIATLVYLILSGASVSTQRAFIMSTVFFGAILFDRPALSLRSFSIALMAVALLKPESVVSPGFQMSFAATGVLIAIYDAWNRSRPYRERTLFGRFRFGATSLAVTSIAASAATAPFAFFHFERLAPLGLVANLIAMPIVSLATVPAAGLAIVLAPFGLSEWGLRAFGASLELILAVAHRAADEGASLAHPIRAMPPNVLMGFTITLALFVILQGWARLTATTLAAASATALWITTPPAQVYWSPSGEVYLNTGGPAYSQIPFLEADALGPLRLENAIPDAACTRARCLYELDEGETVLLLNSNTSVSCAEIAPIDIALAADDLQCPNAIPWSQIEQRGGAEIRLTDTGPHITHPPRCSERPWRQCP
ncbi:MAG: ComEC/Rec2 family competence protein, partial [Pseudomonadota bacterium]